MVVGQRVAPEVEPAGPDQHRPGAGQPGWPDAVENVDASVDCGQYLRLRPDSHQVARFVRLEHGVHRQRQLPTELGRFAQAEATDSVAGEADGADGARALGAGARVEATLD